jgi:sugar-specific transcriptional regulator TrmB
MEELRNAMKSLGFSDQEIAIYIKFLYLKESTASNLGKEMKIHRRSVYDVVERLVKKGVLSFIERDGKKYYKPINPTKIIGLLEEKRGDIENVKKDLSSVMHKIDSMKSFEGVGAEVLFGKEGIKTVYLDELAEGKPIHVICTSIDRTEDLLKNFLVSYTRDRIKKGVSIKAVVAKGAKTRLEKYGLMEVRYLPSDQISPSSLSVYGNKVAITLWSGEPISILVRSREIAESFRNHFEIIWKAARK